MHIICTSVILLQLNFNVIFLHCTNRQHNYDTLFQQYAFDGYYFSCTKVKWHANKVINVLMAWHFTLKFWYIDYFIAGKKVISWAIQCYEASPNSLEIRCHIPNGQWSLKHTHLLTKLYLICKSPTAWHFTRKPPPPPHPLENFILRAIQSNWLEQITVK